MNNTGHELFQAFHRIKKSSMGRIHKDLMQNLKPHEFFMLTTLKNLRDDQKKEAELNQTPLAPGVKISELSRVSSISMPGVSQTISTLEKLGYVCRTASQSDRRLVYVNLTEKGQTMEADVSNTCFQLYEDAATILGASDTLSLIHLLDKLTLAFDQIDQKKCALKQNETKERKTP